MLFDEKYYLRTYSDVRQAVEGKQIGSAFTHYAFYGAYEKRKHCEFVSLHSEEEPPKITLYTLTKNEEFILPFFLEHYSKFVQKIIIYDNNSTDASREIIRSYSNTEIRHFDTNGITDDLTLVEIKNTCYQEQRGKSDYVIVCDADEFLHYPSIVEILKLFKRHKITIANTMGYEMVGDKLPTPGLPLTEQVKYGIDKSDFSKSILFDPEIDINFTPGCHICHPLGNIKIPDIKLNVLHYKYLNLEYVLNKFSKLKLSNVNINNNWGTALTPEKLTNTYNELLEKRRQVIE